MTGTRQHVTAGRLRSLAPPAELQRSLTIDRALRGGRIAAARARGASGPPRALVPALVLLATITAVVSSLGAPLVSSVAETYGAPVTTAQGSLTAALLAGAVFTLVVGRFATGRLRRPMILVGLGVVTVGAAPSAVAAGLGPDVRLGFALLVSGRALQGVGMALLPLAMAVACDELVGGHMERTVAVLSVAVVAGRGARLPRPRPPWPS